MKRQSGSLNKYSMDTCSNKTVMSRLFTYLVKRLCFHRYLSHFYMTSLELCLEYTAFLKLNLIL